MRIVFIITLIVLGFLVFSSCVSKPPKKVEEPPKKEEPKVIRIAGVGPLTGSQSEFGNDQVNGEELAVQEVNAAGGILGMKVEFVRMDDKADPTEAVSVAHKLGADSTIVAVVGHPNSGTAIPSSGIYEQYKLPLVVTTATNPKVTQQEFKYTFRICPTDDVQGSLAAEYAVQQIGKKQLAVIHDRTAYGQGIAEEFKKRAEELGAKIVAFEGVTEGQKDFSAVLTKIKGKKPEVLYFGGMYPEAGLIVKQARSAGIKAVFIAPDGTFDPEFIRIAGKEATGSIITFLAPPWSELSQASAFIQSYNQKFGEVGAFSGHGFDAVNVVLDAIKRAGKADRDAIRNALADPSFQYNGLTGSISFDEKGQLKAKNFFFYTVENDKFTLAKSQ